MHGAGVVGVSGGKQLRKHDDVVRAVKPFYRFRRGPEVGVGISETNVEGDDGNGNVIFA